MDQIWLCVLAAKSAQKDVIKLGQGTTPAGQNTESKPSTVSEYTAIVIAYSWQDNGA